MVEYQKTWFLYSPNRPLTCCARISALIFSECKVSVYSQCRVGGLELNRRVSCAFEETELE